LGEVPILIISFCIIFWCVNKKIGYLLGISFLVSSLAVQGLKIVFRVPRPWVYDPTFSPVDGAVTEATGYAFPSGHTQSGAAFFGTAGAVSKGKILKIIFFTIAILIGFSRLYLGVHYLSDVVVSLVITFVTIYFVHKILDDEKASKKRDFILSLIVALMAVAVIIIAIIVYQMELSDATQLRDSIRIAGAGIGFAIGIYVERTYINFSVKTKNLYLQVAKVVLGLAGAVAIYFLIRLLGSGLIATTLRYFFAATWISLAYPLIIKRFFSKSTL
jgi:undecaprenyl-diphosphatase